MGTARHNQSYISHFMRRSSMLLVLFFSFVMWASAQKYYTIYFDDTSTNPATRYYLSIKSDGTSLDMTSELSFLCYWMTDEELIKTGNDKTTNQENAKTLCSAAFPDKYLIESSTASGSTYPLALSTTASARWLIDNNIKDTPVLYYNNKNYYVYRSSATKMWRFTASRTSVSEFYYVKITPRELLLPPTISVTKNDNTHQVSISATDGSDIYYTLDGSTPTASSTRYTLPFTPNPGTTIKSIAIKGDVNSTVAEMKFPQNFTVTLDDREDHNWTYYSGVNTSVDDGNYNTNYLGKIYSPNPRDVKITYDGNGGAVSINEPETSFVYYKTLECKTVGTGDAAVKTYPYTVISNPFSKRPVIDGKVQGFKGWEIVSGGDFIKDYKNGDVLPLDAEIIFTDLSTDANNPTEIKLKANWVNANIQYLSSTSGNDVVFTDGTYETNILVLKCYTTSITLKSPCTIMMVEPDGSADYRGIYTSTGTMNLNYGAEDRVKIEFTHWNPSTAIDAQGRSFTIGRGMKMSTRQSLCGLGIADVDVNQILKVESGQFTSFTHYAALPRSIKKQWVILGCDYDRAHNDNDKLTFTNTFIVGTSKNLGLTTKQDMCRTYSLSGKFMTAVSIGDAFLENSYYMSINSSTNKGHRYLEIQGGEWGNIAGGTGANTSGDGIYDPTITFRMKGGLLRGSIYGGAQYGGDGGTRTYIITGGTIRGWVAGGANGTDHSGGVMEGASYIYVGGNAKIDSNGSTTRINRAVGGNVFGAGCGYSATSTSGQVTLGTNVVIADNAYVERGVYGGGSYGYCPTDKTANIYITGGTVDGKAGGVDGTNYMDNIQGGIYGGACQNKGGSVNMFMTGGTVNGGVYGGSNASGALSGNVNITIAGGNVGTQEKAASVFGGGYGSGTTINGSTSITMTGGAINGNLFGGGNQGAVNSNTSVTITGGSVTGNVYGGGDKAEVKGKTNVVIGQ